jgi:hypothetical protein
MFEEEEDGDRVESEEKEYNDEDVVAPEADGWVLWRQSADTFNAVVMPMPSMPNSLSKSLSK